MTYDKLRRLEKFLYYRRGFYSKQKPQSNVEEIVNYLMVEITSMLAEMIRLYNDK